MGNGFLKSLDQVHFTVGGGNARNRCK